MQQPPVIEAPRIQLTGPARDPRWRAEYEAFLRLLPKLFGTHRDKFVAIHNGAAVAAVDSFKGAALEAYKHVGYVPLHVGLVSERSLSPVRLPSPRIVSHVAST